MLGWIGACSAAAACAALGFGLAASLRARVMALEDAIRALRLLSRRVVLLREPMLDAIGALGGESRLFALAAASGEGEPEAAFAAALRSLRALQPTDGAVILRLIRESCCAPAGDQAALYEAGIAQLEAHREAATASAATDVKLCRTLGVLAAALVLILAL